MRLVHIIFKVDAYPQDIREDDPPMESSGAPFTANPQSKHRPNNVRAVDSSDEETLQPKRKARRRTKISKHVEKEVAASSKLSLHAYEEVDCASQTITFTLTSSGQVVNTSITV